MFPNNKLPQPKVLKPLKTLQETLDDYIKNDTMRSLVMAILVHLKEYKQISPNLPMIVNRKADSTLMDVSNGPGGRANIHLYNDMFIVAYDLPNIQFAEPFDYKVTDIESAAEEIAFRIKGNHDE